MDQLDIYVNEERLSVLRSARIGPALSLNEHIQTDTNVET